MLVLRERSRPVVQEDSDLVRRGPLVREVLRIPRETDFDPGQLDAEAIAFTGHDPRTQVERLGTVSELRSTPDPAVLELIPSSSEFRGMSVVHLQRLAPDGSFLPLSRTAWGLDPNFGNALRFGGGNRRSATFADGSRLAFVWSHHSIADDGSLGDLLIPLPERLRRIAEGDSRYRTQTALVRFADDDDAPELDPDARPTVPSSRELRRRVGVPNEYDTRDLARRERSAIDVPMVLDGPLPRRLRPTRRYDLQPMHRLATENRSGGLFLNEIVPREDGSAILVGTTQIAGAEEARPSSDTVVHLRSDGTFELLMQCPRGVALQQVAVSPDGRQLVFASNLAALVAKSSGDDPLTENDLLPAAGRIVRSAVASTEP